VPQSRIRLIVPAALLGAFAVASTALGDELKTKQAADTEIKVTGDSFRCLSKMTKVRHFFVDNLLGDVKDTLTIANSEKGGVYPPGSVVQLIPGEVMVKHKPGFNAATRDWEFFELTVSAQGTTIGKRGFTDVINRFGGNCFTCHARAKPEYDLICEMGHGCDPIPISRETIAKIQQGDPRCN